MAHIPQDDVRQLFDENKQKSWAGLDKTLKQHKGKAQGIEDSVIDSLLMVTHSLDRSHEAYPGSADQLQRVLEDQLSQETIR